MKTALITGASSGIGLELARIFAAQQNNLVLVARSGDKLNALAAELKEKHSVTIKIIAADLSDIEQVQQVYDTCQQENIAIEYLVNNAGFGDFKNFANEDWTTIEGMIDLNVKALSKLCHLFIFIIDVIRGPNFFIDKPMSFRVLIAFIHGYMIHAHLSHLG